MAKNSLKMVKKALCLIFAFLLSINSFAAVISNSDGDAFVTKAEFEALKHDFADQMANYNSSVDNKIDGALASYLNSIRINRPIVYDTINKNWGEVFLSTVHMQMTIRYLI